MRSRHEARVRRGDGEPPLAVINVDARSMVRIRESRRVEARGLGCVARGCESFSRSRFPNNEKSAPLTKVIVSRDTVYPRRSVLAVVCVETGRKKFRALACSSPPRAQTVSLDPSSHFLARAPSSFMRGEWTPHRSAPTSSSALSALKPFPVSRLLVCPPARVPVRFVVCPCVRAFVCPCVRVSVCSSRVSVCPCRHPTVADLRRSGKETRLRRGKYFIPGEA